VKPTLSWLLLLTLAFLVWLAIAVRNVRGDPPPDEPTVPPAATPIPTAPTPVSTLEVAALRRRLRLEHRRLVAARRRARGLARTLQHTSSTREAIELACSVYGSCSILFRRAECESGGYAYARNPSGASGLFQFLPSTWASTPFADFSVWSPYANALAAGWMQAHGRGGEWACR